jgi:hypothetical protein
VDNHFPNGIPDHFILLDSDSTVSIFNNSSFLTNIRNVDDPLCLKANGGGSQVSYQMGDVAGFGPVWYNPESVANILSLAEVRCICRVTMDSAQEPAFHVHKADGTGTTVFFEHPSKLYLHDASVGQLNNSSANVTAKTKKNSPSGNSRRLMKPANFTT